MKKKLLAWSLVLVLLLCVFPFRSSVQADETYDGEILTTAAETITVKLTVLGDTHHEMAAGDTGHGLWLGGLETWLEETEYTVNSGDTAWDLFCLAFDEDDTLTLFSRYTESFGSEYIYAVQKDDVMLQEKDNCANSGWMVAVNGEHIQVGVSKMTLADGDSVILHWCDDYLADEAARPADPEVIDFWIEEDSVEVPATKTIALTPVFEPDGVTEEIFWSSSSEKVATIDENGVVTGKVVGKATITAETVSGFTDTCEVRVLFSDVTDKSKANFEAIYSLVDKGVIAGFKGGEYFAPNDQCTRGQVVLFLWRAAGKPKPESTTLTFKDAADIEKLGTQYKQAVLWGNENDIVKGFTSGTNKGKFMPNDPCTRAQIVLFLYRYMGKPKVSQTELNFKDADTIRKMAKDYTNAILWAVEKKITTGYKVGSTYEFRPNQNCTRGECATFLYRAVK